MENSSKKLGSTVFVGWDDCHMRRKLTGGYVMVASRFTLDLGKVSD